MVIKRQQLIYSKLTYDLSVRTVRKLQNSVERTLEKSTGTLLQLHTIQLDLITQLAKF
jgi:hypothetical protein